MLTGASNSDSLNEDVKLVPTLEELTKPKKPHICQTILWMLYVSLVGAVGLLGFIRLFALLMHIEWRNDLDDTFPIACGDWAIGDGCTRVT